MMKVSDILAKLSDTEWIEIRYKINNSTIYEGKKGWIINSIYFSNKVKAIATYSLDDISVLVIYVD